MNGISIIPTQCPKFLAACATAGVELQNGTPGISNVYDKAKKYDPEEPGTISFHLSDQQGINPLAIAKIWLNPDMELAEVEALQGRFSRCSSPEQWEQLANDVDDLHRSAAIATIRKFVDGKFAIDSRIVSDEEERAAKTLSGMAAEMRKPTGMRNKIRLGSATVNAWQPAMFAWVKAWIFNYLELRDAWKSARPAIKIEREDGAFPLVIPKGKNFEKLLRRWVS